MSIEIQATDAIGAVGGTSTHVPTLSLEGKTVYLAGPMSGRPDLNYPAFHRVAAALRGPVHGVAEVINPAEVELPAGATWEEYMAVGLASVARADVVVALPGWTDSRGASIEVSTARALGLTVASASLVLPAGATWEEYMAVGLASVARADVVVALPGWTDSRGASIEVSTARALGLTVASASLVLPEGVVGETPAWESPAVLARVAARTPRVWELIMSDEFEADSDRRADLIVSALFDEDDELAPAGMVMVAGYALDRLLSIFRLLRPSLSVPAAWLQMRAIMPTVPAFHVESQVHLMWGSWLALAPHQRGEFTLAILGDSEGGPEQYRGGVKRAASMLAHAAVSYRKFAEFLAESPLVAALREAGMAITEVEVEQ